MKAIKLFLLTHLIFFCHLAQAQVKTNFNNETLITIQGRFAKNYKIQIDFELPSKNINELLEKEKNEMAKSNETKPFRLAVPVSVDLDIAKLTNWTYDKEYAYGKFTVKLNGALSASINFDKFYLPKATEMYVYNENGNMITGPVTENENNTNKIWGSWVYRGQFLTIEIKTPVSTKEQLLLHSSNIAYGYKEVYKSLKVGGFGQSGTCNINVLCPLGNGWEPERNSVALILDANGQYWCSGSMIMNTCTTNQPFFLTANHCYATNPVQNVSAWRFTFQAWSATCTPSQNSDGVIYNGSTLRANWTNSDFCLVELNNTPPTNSGINYSGWTRSTTPAQNATGIHHPSGDVMKISRAANPVSIASAFGTTNQHWRADWTEGVTEGGSSGSPLYDQNHRIIGQLHGGPSACGSSQLWDFYGRFDLSWTGGGTNTTRLSNWLDPSNSGAMTTNTTNVANLSTIGGAINSVVGYYTVNSGTTQTSIANDTYQQIYVPRSSTVTISFFITTNNFLTYNWSYDNVTASGLQFVANFTAPANGYGSITKNVYLDANDGCGIVRRTYTFQINSLGWSFSIATSPNPTSDKLNVSITKIEKSNGKVINEITDEKQTNKPGKTIFRVYSINTSQLMKQWAYNEADLTNYSLDIKGLKPGMYVLKMERDGQTTTSKILVQ
ncbi:MAG: T9SS type A sorting domain-containing protein [Sediminibacterium sp.]|nr:T9SS type A sorting domain-containing protein [Sediminibacterium sp.]MDP3127200.1 T9SS type A sorting domain-containing protein [Sediminibacterium sp.]